MLKHVFQKMALFTSESFKTSLCVCHWTRFVQVEALISVDEATDLAFSPYIQIHTHKGGGLLWLTGTVWGLLSQAFSGISSRFIP